MPGILALLVFGLNLGLDFTGGSLVEVRFEEEVETEALQEELIGLGFTDNVVQTTRDDTTIIRIRELSTFTGIDPLSVDVGEGVSGSLSEDEQEFVPPDEDERLLLLADLEQAFGPLEEIEYQSIGPSIGDELVRRAIYSIIIASVLIVGYVMFSFRQVPEPASSFRFGLAAITALLHDILFLLGVFAILGEVMSIELDAMFVVAALTVMGFSVHDTIVVFDRIRENLIKHPTENFEHVVNNSVLETLGRSLNTSVTVVFTLLALLIFGGASVSTFVFALLVGILIGAYSSIFFASPLLIDWQNWVTQKGENKK